MRRSTEFSTCVLCSDLPFFCVHGQDGIWNTTRMQYSKDLGRTWTICARKTNPSSVMLSLGSIAGSGAVVRKAHQEDIRYSGLHAVRQGKGTPRCCSVDYLDLEHVAASSRTGPSTLTRVVHDASDSVKFFRRVPEELTQMESAWRAPNLGWQKICTCRGRAQRAGLADAREEIRTPQRGIHWRVAT